MQLNVPGSKHALILAPKTSYWHHSNIRAANKCLSRFGFSRQTLAEHVVRADIERGLNIEADTLLIYTTGHGGIEGRNDPFLELADGRLYSYELADLVRNVPAHRRVLIADQCSSYDFAQSFLWPCKYALAASLPGGDTYGTLFPNRFFRALAQHGSLWEAFQESKGWLTSSQRATFFTNNEGHVQIFQ
ncbi:hypothetical protein D6789_01475 [Candidatus Woesearchaeota archaeon]|nr:MAG: hypothetical protein D6789_01475 [Candidatus Woesearchaeota archaeon]